MTIPIRPGPWSFLATLGQGIGETAKADAEFDKNDRAEATKHVATMFEAVQKGELTTSALKSPFFLQLLKRSGIAQQFDAEANVAAKPQEQINRAQSEALSPVLSSIMSPEGTPFQKEELTQGRVATQLSGVENRVKVGVGQVQAQAAEDRDASGAPTALARQTAKIQTPEGAVAAEQAATDPFYGSVAERSVDATMTQLGVTSIDSSNMAGIADQAWQLAQRDAKSRGYTLNEEMTKPYIEANVQSALRKQEERDAKIIAARGRAGDQTTRLLELYQRQQQRVNDAIRSLVKPSGLDEAMSLAVGELAAKTNRTPEQVMQDPATPQDVKSAYITVQTYKRTLAGLQAEAAALRDNNTQLLGSTVGAPDPSALPAPSERRPGTGPAFNSPPPPDARGEVTQKRKSARYKELVAAERKKPATQQRTQQQIMAQVDSEIDKPIDLNTFGKTNTPAAKPAPVDLRKRAPEVSDSPTRRGTR